jgi:hypothetical protein
MTYQLCWSKHFLVLFCHFLCAACVIKCLDVLASRSHLSTAFCCWKSQHFLEVFCHFLCAASVAECLEVVALKSQLSTAFCCWKSLHLVPLRHFIIDHSRLSSDISPEYLAYMIFAWDFISLCHFISSWYERLCLCRKLGKIYEQFIWYISIKVIRSKLFKFGISLFGI